MQASCRDGSSSFICCTVMRARLRWLPSRRRRHLRRRSHCLDWSTLPPTCCVLRAGAVLGTTFEAALVARLLEEPLSLVLEKLQEATDAGVPLADRGEGQLTWPAPLVAALQQSTLPSLLRFWHARLGELLSGGQPFDPTSRPRGAPRMVARGQRGAQAEDAV